MNKTASAAPARLLIVDDEYSIRLGYYHALNSENIIVELEGDPVRALVRLQEVPFDGMLLDLVMPSMDGLSMAKIQADRQIICPTILASAMATTDHVVTATRMGIVDFLSKPVNLEELRVAVNHILWRKNTFAHLQPELIRDLPPHQQYEASKFYLQRRDFRQAKKILTELLQQTKDPASEILLGLIAEAERHYDLAGKHYTEGVLA